MTLAAQRGLEPLRHVLGNGAVVIAKQAPTIPAVTIQATFVAGSAYDPPSAPGLAFFLSRVIDRGTERRSADAIADELDRRGVSLTIAVARHTLSIACTCLSDDFDAMLELLVDVARRPVFPANEIETRRGEIVTAIRQDQDNPAVTAHERLLELLYPDGHPYGRRVKGSIAAVEAVGRKSLAAFHAERFAPSALSLVVVGDVEPSRVVDAGQSLLDDWRGPIPAMTTVEPPRPTAGRRTDVVTMMNKVQADLAYGFVAVARTDPEYHACWVMNNALGQYALGGRLGDNIRERQGMAYYVFSSLDATVGKGPLVVRAGVHPANVDRAIEAVDHEMASAAADGFTDREVAESKQYLIGSIPRNLETNAGIASFLQTAEFFGLGLDYDIRLPDLISAVSRDQVIEAARRLLTATRATIVVAGPYAPGGGSEVQ